MTLIQLRPVSVTRRAEFPIETMLTRLWNVVLKLAAPGLAKGDLPWQGWIVGPLTIQQPDLISDRQVPVLHCRFRIKVCLRKWTYRKENRKNYHIVNGCRTSSDSPDLPHDFLPFQPYLIFRRRVNKPSDQRETPMRWLTSSARVRKKS